MLKKIKRWILKFKDGIMAAACLIIMGYGLSGIAHHRPVQKPWEWTAPSLASAIASEGVSDNDILATEQDEDDGKITPLKPGLIAKILNDKEHRISKQFVIPDDLKKRVEFWFNVYATYTISHAVLHDTTHPWIIYEILNLNQVYKKPLSREKRDAAKSKMIRDARYAYVNILDKLSKQKHYQKLSAAEKKVYLLFKDIPGSRQNIFAKAKNKVRVQLGQRDSVVYAIKKSGRYLESMEQIFEKNNLPAELTRIPFLESSFNLDAYSKDGASGIWQFMYKTGKVFLKVSQAQGIDERDHPLKATQAATRLLRQNYQILKSWPLAVTAYNHGPGGLLRGIQKTGSRNLNTLIENYRHPYFGFASKNFYSEFLAMLRVEKYQDKIFGYVNKDKHLIHDDIEIKYPMRVKFVMALCNVTQKEIKLYNPDLRNKSLSSRAYLPEGYYLKLPKDKKKALLAFYEEVDETNRLLDQLLGPN